MMVMMVMMHDDTLMMVINMMMVMVINMNQIQLDESISISILFSTPYLCSRTILYSIVDDDE